MYAPAVLLVFPDTVLHETALRILGRIGVAIHATDDAAEALALFMQHSIVVVDVRHPDADAVLAAIAGREPHPVVIATGAEGVALDPDVVTLVVPYDAQTLVGVLLACVTENVPLPPFEAAAEHPLSS